MVVPVMVGDAVKCKTRVGYSARGIQYLRAADQLSHRAQRHGAPTCYAHTVSHARDDGAVHPQLWMCSPASISTTARTVQRVRICGWWREGHKPTYSRRVLIIEAVCEGSPHYFLDQYPRNSSWGKLARCACRLPKAWLVSQSHLPTIKKVSICQKSPPAASNPPSCAAISTVSSFEEDKAGVASDIKDVFAEAAIQRV